MLSPNTPAQTPTARARSRSSVKTLLTIERATGFSIEPPMPCIARKAMSQLMSGREGAQDRGDAEQGQAGQEDPTAPEPIRHGSREHEQAAQDERVRIDSPLQPGDPGAEILLDRGQGYVHDRGVHAHHEHAQAADGQDQHPLPVGKILIDGHASGSPFY